MAATLIMVLTFVFGIVPATFLVMFALVFGAAGIAAVGSSIWEGDAIRALLGLSFVLVAVMSLYGYIGLFYAAGDMVTPRVARWLLSGLVATFAAVGFVEITEPGYSMLDAWYILFLPSTVAVVHLIRFLARATHRHGGV